jgi:demethylmenaquinone methyltransferase/2-methoxy-6-polyprenyl-1,4-benzoquinol methylase
MPGSFFSPGPERATRVHDLFERIASRYDLINDLQSFGLHRHWKRKVVRLASVKPGDRALDLCCGTGDIAFKLARAGADVIGIDFSEKMLAIARARSRAIGLADRISFTPGDAQRLPFPDNLFDAVTIGYGLRNLADWEAALGEMVRVARSSGAVVVLEFGRPANRVWRGLYFSYLRLFVPLLGLLFCGSFKAYSYILESLTHYPGQNAVAAKMDELNLRNVRVLNLLGGAMSINYGRK